MTTPSATARSETGSTNAARRGTVLCVDDEPMLLSGISLHLRRRYEVLTANSGAEGLAILAKREDVAVVVSDMQMPGMDGATFLRQVREANPNQVRLLLSGGSDLTAAIAAVNEGQIFRFLAKPCAAPALLRTIEAAFEHHRLLTAEKVLLEETLQGSIKALVDVLALANPTSFGQASRVKALVTKMVDALAIEDRWQIEVAAMLAPLGCVTLPPATLEAMLAGRPLADPEEAMVRRVPAVTDALLRSIPRLEDVRAMILAAADPTRINGPPRMSPEVAQGAAILRAVGDFDLLVNRGDSPALALLTLRSRSGRYPAAVLDTLETVTTLADAEENQPETAVREVLMSSLMVGMVLVTDLKTAGGILVAARGSRVTIGLVERAANMSEAERRLTVRVTYSPNPE